MYDEKTYHRIQESVEKEFGLEFLNPQKIGRKKQLPELKRIRKSFRILPFLIDDIEKIRNGETFSNFVENSVIERINKLSRT